jgi:hypothetical protein
MATEGGTGPDTTAIEVAIHALEARDEPDRLWIEARAELAALVAAAGRAGALAAALRPILGASVWQRGVTGTEFVHPETQINVTMKRKHLEALQAAARGVPADARPGAAGARDGAAGLYAALDGVLATCEWVRDEGVGVGVPLGLLRRLRRFLAAPRAGGAGEGTEG